jgi:hypothetical protein
VGEHDFASLRVLYTRRVGPCFCDNEAYSRGGEYEEVETALLLRLRRYPGQVLAVQMNETRLWPGARPYIRAYRTRKVNRVESHQRVICPEDVVLRLG